MSRAPRPVALVVLVAGLLLLAACGGLPDSLREQAATVEAQIARRSVEIDEKAKQYEELAASGEFDFLRPYAEREGWQAKFADARDAVGHAREVYTGKVAPLIEQDREEDAESLRQQLARIRASLDEATSLARHPLQRAEVLRDARDRAPELVRRAQELDASIQGEVGALASEVERASADYPAKSEDLAGRLAAVRKLSDESSAKLALARKEMLAMGDGGADVAVLADSAARVDALEGEVKAAALDVRGKIGELYRSYSKTLIDMKEVYKVEIGRTSWNESYDFPTEHEYKYKREVDEELLEKLESYGDRPIAKIMPSWGSSKLSTSVPAEVWNALEINPAESFPGNDNAAEFWVGESQSDYFHRYAIVEGAERKETEWQPVSAELYDKHFDDLGMDILAKPYGAYEDEAIDEAMPPGMAYVGNPKYGRWETEPSGRRHWSWAESFLFYHLIFGGPRHYYYHNDWDHWNRGYRGRRSWYGRDAGQATYGTYGSKTRKSSRYAGSAFARGGGFRSQDSSARGAGPSGRGGGPGSRGK